ncbi:hypothetical protein Tco_1347624 [Tanacetum coccineum]
MTKVIKGEFKKITDIKVEDVSLTCDTQLEVFNKEVSRLSGIYSDLFTFEVEVANITCDLNMDDDSKHEAHDDMCYDPSDVAFTEWFKTYEDYKDDWIYEWNENVPWVYDKPWLDNGIWKEPTPVKQHCKPFNYKTECSEWPTCSWRKDGCCNGGNFLGAYVIGNSLHYQDLGWYEALEDSELKEEALRNKAIMEGLIEEEDNDESRYKQRRRWNMYTNYEINHDVAEREELCEIHEFPVCNIRSFEMIKYSFGQDKEYVAIKEDEYEDLARTSEDSCRAYQEIFRMMDGN